MLLLSAAAQGATLVGYAELPADTFLPGLGSDQTVEPASGPAPPFPRFSDKHPVQGFSALLAGQSGSFLALSDNGFGRRDNSAGYSLCFYKVRSDFRTADGGSGRIKITGQFRLRDTDKHLQFAITREADRLLTGADLDPESFRMAPDGSLWVGEEFLPALLHFGGKGNLLAPPFTLAGLASPDNPAETKATLPRSRGFEGMGQSPDGRWLYPMLEGTLIDAEPGLNIYTFDTATERFINDGANDPSYRYRLDEGAEAIGDFTLYSANAGLVIERDSGEGDEAAVKRIYRVVFGNVDDDGFLAKTLVADLLDIDDPHDLDRDGSEHFRFPFWTPEGLEVIDATTIAVVNDNNYPFGKGREPFPEHTEMILLQIPPLW